MNLPNLLAHRYRILQKLSSGGFGDTFLAEDTHLPSGKTCVIKQLKPINNNLQIYQVVQERFKREAILLEDLGNNHPQIPNLYAYFEENQHFYLVQEYIEGQTLTHLVEKQGKQNEDNVKQILLSILNILEYVEEKGIIHRDIKPDNIIIREGDRIPVLIDFGAVRETMGTVISSSGRSTQSIVIGTPGFMPPEQSAGRPVFSSDLYALGLTAIYLLTAKLPQELETNPLNGEILWHHKELGISPRLESLIDQTIKPQVAERFPTATAMREAIETQLCPPTLKQTVSTPSTIISASPSKETQISHLPKILATVAGIGTLLIGSLIFLFMQTEKESIQSATPVDSQAVTELENPTNNNQAEEQQRILIQQQQDLERQLAEQQKILAAQQHQIQQQQQQLTASFPEPTPPQSTVNHLTTTNQPQRGMWVIKVTDNSEADLAGFRTGQILVSLNDVYIDRVENANWIVGQNVNQPIRALVWENGRTKPLTVTPRDQYIGVTLCQLARCPNGREE